LVPVKKESVRNQVFEQLKDNVLRRTWAPGSKLPSENELAASMGVSRVSVREGIRSLVALGLLESRQGEGTFVKEFSGEIYLNALFPLLALDKTGIFHVLEYRRVMERGTVAIVVEKATDEIIAKLEASYEAMVRLKDDIPAFAHADLDFHLALAEATGNPIIAKVNNIIKDILGVSMEGIVESLGVRDGLYYHRKILDAIKARDSAKAESLMAEHIVRTMERLKKEKGFKDA
jgi:GntR family transcriptional regulator, transcriptional repressor for pyruvate dehydrogenase complex